MPSGRGETADAHVAVVTGADGQAVRGECLGDLAPPSAGPDPHQAAFPVQDLDMLRARRSMTIPPSLAERLLMPWPPLRTANGTSCLRANARASATCCGVLGHRTSPGEPGHT